MFPAGPLRVTFRTLLLLAFCYTPFVQAQWDYAEDLSLFLNADVLRARADYQYYYGWNPLGLGASLHGLIDNQDQEDLSAIGFAGLGSDAEAIRIGYGVQQRDPETGFSPVLELRYAAQLENGSELQLYLQNERDGAGLGGGVRFRMHAEITTWAYVDFLADAAYFEETGEDLDGHLSFLLTPFTRLPALGFGPALSFDESTAEFGLLIGVVD